MVMKLSKCDNQLGGMTCVTQTRGRRTRGEPEDTYGDDGNGRGRRKSQIQGSLANTKGKLPNTSQTCHPLQNVSCIMSTVGDLYSNNILEIGSITLRVGLHRILLRIPQMILTQSFSARIMLVHRFVTQ